METKVLSKVVVEITKELKSLANCVVKSSDPRCQLKCICLDIDESKAVASDGHILQIKHIAIIDKSEYNNHYFAPLVEAKEFRKMCSLAGKTGASLVCSLLDKGQNKYWRCECKGVISETRACRFVNYLSVIPKINHTKTITICEDVWKEAKKWVKENKNFDFRNRLFISHDKNSEKIRFIMCDNNNYIEYPIYVTGTPKEEYTLCFSIQEFLNITGDTFALALPYDPSRATVCLGKKTIGVITPNLIRDIPNKLNGQIYNTWKFSEGCDDDALDICGFSNEGQNKAVPHVQSTNVVNNTTEPQKTQQNENKSRLSITKDSVFNANGISCVVIYCNQVNDIVTANVTSEVGDTKLKIFTLKDFEKIFIA